MCNNDNYKLFVFGLFKLSNGFQRDNFKVYKSPETQCFGTLFFGALYDYAKP